MRQPKFKRAQIIRLSRLLNMMYRPGEIAEEIGVTTDTVTRSYLPAGAPHTRDASGNIWIHGVSFRNWATEVIGTKRSRTALHPMTDDQAWCVKCNQVVTMASPRTKHLKRNLDLMQGKCPVCGTKINRVVSARVEPKAVKKPAQQPEQRVEQ